MYGVSIDLGGSTVDVILFDENKETIKKISLESKEVEEKTLENVFELSGFQGEKFEKIILTGGYNRIIPLEYKGMPVIKVPEIQAIAYGGSHLAKVDDALIISMGTGTCMVSYKQGTFQHVGGTAMGGGTFVGLGSLILQDDNALSLEKLAKKGDLSKVDLSVEDIVGGPIGILPGFATASNFGKLHDPSKEDLALGICNLIGQTIGSLGNFLSQTHYHKNIVLTGKVTRIKTIVDIIHKTAKIYNRSILLPENADYVSAIGAMLTYDLKKT